MGFIHLRLGGFFREEDIGRFVVARRLAVEKLALTWDQRSTLIDIRELAIQSQQGVRDFQAIINNPSLRSKYLALVTAKSLARMQAQRIAEKRDARFFQCVEEAKAWLKEARLTRR